MGKLGFLPEPELMLEGTISVVEAVCSYASIGGWPLHHFLGMQRYDPSQTTDARYTLTFDLCGKSCARVLVDSKLETIDLADLLGHPWEDYQVAGYDRIWISHPDWRRLTDEEIRELEEQVADDLLFDYSEDELSLWFEASPDRSFLLVHVQEILTEEDDEEDPDH